MRFRHAPGVIIFSIAWLCAAPVLRANPIDYGDFFGLNPGDVDFLMVREDSATDPTPLYGPPLRVGNSFLFNPLAFASFASNGGADTTSGSLSMRVRADVGSFLETITIRETGDTTLLGLFGTNATASTINGLMVLTAIDPATGQMFSAPLSVNPAAPYKLPDNTFVEFQAQTTIDLTGLGIREVVLIFNNNLQTTSEAGTTAFIQKKMIIIDAPEPASLALLAFGALLIRRRRR